MSESGASNRPGVPTPAATVVLARDRPQGGFEVFLVQRHQRMGFMGGMFVFPGGKLGPEDDEAVRRGRVIDAQAHAGAWGEAFSGERSAALAVAAIRETFEEAGVLLAKSTAGAPLEEARRRLLAGEDFVALLEGSDLQLELSALTPLSRWITPSAEPRRYDTCFYLAQSPAGQEADHDRHESIAGRWRSPQEALDDMAAGTMRLAPPTARTLECLLPCASLGDALALARQGEPPVIEPIIRQQDDAMMIYFPGDPEHPVATKALPGPTRAVLRYLR